MEMKSEEALEQISSKQCLDKVYQFSYRRCASCFEAEELCAEIILAVISAIKKQEQIMDFYAFLWTIAHRVYADYCKKRKKHAAISMEELEKNGYSFWGIQAYQNEIDRMIDDMAEGKMLKRIFEEISFLSKAYRDTMVMYYIDGRKTGEPEENDPRVKAERILSQNLIYLCRNKSKRVKELSEALCVPMPYIEEELEIQCRGENGKYGLLRKLGEGRYIANIRSSSAGLPCLSKCRGLFCI